MSFFPCIQISPLYKDCSRVGLGAGPHSRLNTPVKALSLNEAPLRATAVRATACPFLERHHSAQGTQHTRFSFRHPPDPDLGVGSLDTKVPNVHLQKDSGSRGWTCPSLTVSWTRQGRELTRPSGWIHSPALEIPE